MAGLYIHIPFCKSRCLYCGFFSSTLTARRGDYVDALCREMLLRSHEPTERIHTVYLGGGTPSQLSGEQLRQIFHQVEDVYGTWLADDMEVTMECNPDDVTDAFCDQLRRLPVNRVSMGAQTFSDHRLRFLNRRHRSADVPAAVRRLRQAGIANISVDLMFGFPDETLAEWESDISKALALQVEHLSAYSLMYEEGTPLYRLLEQGRVAETDEELYRQMYGTLIDRLTAAGYDHYEISNFARPTRSSRHNSAYWTGVPYIGLGAAAHSYDIRTRSWNAADIDQYIQALSRGRRPYESETLDAPARYNDRIVTALRMREGLRLDLISPQEQGRLLAQAQPFLSSGALRLQDGRLHLTREGIYVSDTIMAELMWV